MLRKIAYINAGGTIASMGRDAFDLLDYNATGERIDAASLVERSGANGIVADIVPVEFRRLDSTAISNRDWVDLVELCRTLAADASIDGMVVGQGTASLEETAWLLALVLRIDKPVVVTGSMRPVNGISSDSGANLAGAVRVAAGAAARGAGVLVVLNDEIHAPRAVAKTHTLRLNAFQSPWSGPIGFVDGPMVRLAVPAALPELARFRPELVRGLPRVDIVYSHIGADGTAIRAFVAAGARGLVSAGFGPGVGTPAEIAALGEAVAAGIPVVQSSRVGAGHVVDSAHHRDVGILAGSDLNPQKARILLALCLARGDHHAGIAEVFAAL